MFEGNEIDISFSKKKKKWYLRRQYEDIFLRSSNSTILFYLQSQWNHLKRRNTSTQSRERTNKKKKKSCDSRNWDLVLCNNLVSKLLQPRQIQNQKQKRRLSDSLISPIYFTATISSPSWISLLPTWELLISPSQLRRKVLPYNFSKKHGIRKEEINKLRISGRLIQWNSNNFFFPFWKQPLLPKTILLI